MERLVEIEKFESEESTEVTLRPDAWDDYIGQEQIKKNLGVFIEASKIRDEALDHVLFYGPPGLGKTTLALIIANEMNANIKVTAAPMIEKSGDLAALLTNLEEGDILFIDEIHRLSPAVEEILYSSMEDFRIDIIIGSGPAAQTVKIDLPRFTLIGATTRAGMLSNPLRDRFGMNFRMQFYSSDELAKIVSQASKKLDKEIVHEACIEIAKRSRGTPRIALRLLRRVRDFADVAEELDINHSRTQYALDELGINSHGFDEMDIRLLNLLVGAKGRAMGLSTIAAALSEDEGTVEDVLEPYLIANGYLERTAKGRKATRSTYEILNISIENEEGRNSVLKPQYFVAILFATALYWMYLLYAPFLMAMTIAALLAVSTSEIQAFFERSFRSKLVASLISSLLLAALFFAPLGYFLATLTIKLKTLEPEVFLNIEIYIKNFIENPPVYLQFMQPYVADAIKELNINGLTSNVLSTTATVGKFSAGFLKNAFLIIIFYFFAQYNGAYMIEFLKRVVQMSVDETTVIANEISSVMSVVFYSIIVTAMFEGILFGLAVSFMGYNGLLFGIMYGFASLIPVVGGVLMWLPFMLYEFSIGNTSEAIFIALYSIVVISIIADTFIKPWIIKTINYRLLKENDNKINELVIFFAIIAGLATFGFWGMILGPAITAFFLTILKLFEERTNEYKPKPD